MKLDYYRWNYEKNLKLKAERGISFEQVIMHIERGDILDVVRHPNQEKYPNQQIIVVEIDNLGMHLTPVGTTCSVPSYGGLSYELA